MSRWLHRLIPPSLRRPANGDSEARHRALEDQLAVQQMRVDRLRRELARHPEDEFTIRLRHALTGE